MNISLNISRSKKSAASSGFTLIEIMVAILVFMIVMGAVYSTWAVVMRATQVGQTAAANAQRKRVALNTIENSLMCIQSFQASQKYYSFIVMSGDTPSLSFTSRLPDVFPRNGKFIGYPLRRLTFALEAAKGNSKDLVLRQNPVLMDMDDAELKEPLTLAHNVKTFLVECWDTNQLDWVTEWDNTNAIPPLLRISMVFGGTTSGGDTTPDTAITRTYSMPSMEMPAVVETGIGGPGGVGNQPGGLNLPGGGGRVNFGRPSQ